MTLSLSVHGAARTVTGSCFEFRSGNSRILLDCGLFQGSRSLETLNYEALAFDPKSIDAVILSHAQIDHSGLLPRLVAEGFMRLIYPPTSRVGAVENHLEDPPRLFQFVLCEREGVAELLEQDLDHTLELALLVGRKVIKVSPHRDKC